MFTTIIELLFARSPRGRSAEVVRGRLILLCVVAWYALFFGASLVAIQSPCFGHLHLWGRPVFVLRQPLAFVEFVDHTIGFVRLLGVLISMLGLPLALAATWELIQESMRP